MLGETLIRLLQCVFNTPQDGKTPFLHFCAHGMQEQLELAIIAGSAINATDAVSL